MAQKWYQSRTNQGAVIGGLFLVLAAFVSGWYSSGSSDRGIPTLEIRTVAEGSEQVLARLALDPRGRVVDSLDFTRLRSEMLVDQEMGIAIELPTKQQWTAGALGNPGVVSLALVPWLGEYVDNLRAAWEVETWPEVKYFGVRLDHPTRIRIAATSKIDGVTVGENPLDDSEFRRSFRRLITASAESQASEFQVEEYLRTEHARTDSVIASRLPRDTTVYSGVFVAELDSERLPPVVLGLSKYMPLLDRAVGTFAMSIFPPDFLYLDRNAGTALFNVRTRLSDVWVNDEYTKEAIINEAGYAVQVDNRVYVVLLQYVSTEPREVLTELERFFRSVRLRGQSGAGS